MNVSGREAERLHCLKILVRKFRPYTEEEAMEVAKLEKVLKGEPLAGKPMSLADFEKEWLK
jgi:hypothetical protein